MREVLSPALSHVLAVKDDQGRHFIPSHGIDDLREWDWTRGYLVNVGRTVTFTVRGALIDAEASPINLEPGWHTVPFLGQAPMPVSQALASLGGTLVLARDAEGRTYASDSPQGGLETLMPGEAYQLFLSSAASYVYGGDTTNGDGAVNMAALQALPTRSRVPGETISLSGHHAPRDGGGGTFTLQHAPDLVCDGALVVCPSDQLGPEISDTFTFTSSQSIRRATVSRPPVAPGTLTLTLSATDAGGSPWALSIPDAYLHGTTHQMRDEWIPAFDFGTGRFNENRNTSGRPFGSYLAPHLGSGWQALARFRYRQVVGPLRWVRTHDAGGQALPGQGQVWEARWFGCRAHDEQAYFDNTNCLNWAMLQAKRANQAEPGRVAEIKLSRNGAGGDVFYYLRSIQVADGLALTGSAGAHVVDAVDDFGNSFRPVRRRDDAVILRVLPERAPGCTGCGHVLGSLDMRRPFGDPNRVAPTPDVLLGNNLTAVHPENGAATWAVRDLVLDGNIEGQDVWASRFTSDQREGNLRNSPGYSGIAQTVHGAKNVAGQRLTIERTYVTGYAATGVLTAIGADTTFVRDVSVGDAKYNHAAYLLGPLDAENLGAHGEAWGHFEIYGGRIRNLVAENLTPGRSGANAVFSWRGGDFDSCAAITTRPCGTYVDGMYADMRGSNRTFPTQGLGPSIRIRDAVIVQRPGSGLTLWHENGNGHQKQRYHHFGYEDVRIHLSETSSAGTDLFRVQTMNESYFRNIQLAEASSSAGWSTLLRLGAGSRGDRDGAPFGVVYDQLGTSEVPIPVRDFASAYFSTQDTPHHFFFLNSAIDGQGIIRGHVGSSKGTGRMASVCSENRPCAQTDMAQLYFENVQLPAGSNRYRDGELFFETSRFRNVTDPTNGATSEDAGAFTCTGEQTYTVSTNLYWRPHATRGLFTTSGGPRVESVEYVDAQGRPVGPNYLAEETFREDARKPFAQVTFASACASGTRIMWEAAVSRWLNEEGQPVTVPAWYQR